MKTFTFFLLLVGGALSNKVAESDVDFGNKVFWKVLESPLAQRNLVLSPYGVSSVLRMLQLGADGRTHMQMRAAMGYSVQDRGVPHIQRKLQKELSSETALKVANAVFVQRTLLLEKVYRRSFLKTFQQSLHQVDFTDPQMAGSVINHWVSDHTDGMIPKFLHQDSINVQTQLLLLNAIHFQGKWKVPFDPKGTHERLFHMANGSTVLVPMMQQTNRFSYGEFVTPDGVDYDVIELPYQGDALGMLLLSPFQKDVPLSALIQHIDNQVLKQWRKEMRPLSRQLILPRFSISTETELNGVLSDLGMNDMFSMLDADFSKITVADENLYVSKVLQKVKIEVNEEGTKGSAATAAIMYSRMAIEEVTLDRPFLFLVQHKPTGTVLFMGQVMEPSRK
ncbi:plasminogen activator inhibitor 1 [Erpetoichthys calabaricus]|uniref:Plasminogen activator inhibitor 1 n=1 Tax=Erpetoichthys calabaricus TaxID=27687 RepID=A0A8C4SB65_ERPCA|nr:plasminogen activator inhibitor 1 [Erpetoichthys calabaricus]